jgi:hypothetical protein
MYVRTMRHQDSAAQLLEAHVVYPLSVRPAALLTQHRQSRGPVASREHHTTRCGCRPWSWSEEAHFDRSSPTVFSRGGARTAGKQTETLGQERGACVILELRRQLCTSYSSATRRKQGVVVRTRKLCCPLPRHASNNTTSLHSGQRAGSCSPPAST